ncbi:IS630 family transposase [Paraburkholderia youngii]|uniref:IS630 family transposase n=1 Tax=Paraburkholderia youngii TaxID=2782701 RepID=A0A7Y6K7M8_9BURK|nr:IS630 family transposase [Paraburkholderia youngii]NUY05920.1 IS630 family transposase [Paraburkholderia youngii]
MAKMDDATRKRVRAGRLMLAGKTPAEAAKMVGVARQTAYTWKARLEEGGIDALRVMATGRPAQLDAAQLEGLRAALLQSPLIHGFGTELWTLKRVRVLIERLYGVTFSEVHVWRLLGALGFSSQKPERRAIERNEDAVLTWKRKTWPTLKKSVPAEGRLIVFIDESGLSERPTRVRTWAPKGCTPIIQYHFNWKHVSAIAGLNRTNFVFRLHDGAIKSAQIIEFLKALRAQLRRKLMIVWDGAAQHKSRVVREYLDSTDGAIQMALLPGYAPDLNPVEYLWAWLKRHALANFCPDNLAELKHTARSKLKSGQKRKSIIIACWKQAELW